MKTSPNFGQLVWWAIKLNISSLCGCGYLSISAALRAVTALSFRDCFALLMRLTISNKYNHLSNSSVLFRDFFFVQNVGYRFVDYIRIYSHAASNFECWKTCLSLRQNFHLNHAANWEWIYGLVLNAKRATSRSIDQQHIKIFHFSYIQWLNFKIENPERRWTGLAFSCLQSFT